MADEVVDMTAPVDTEAMLRRAEDEQFAQMQSAARQEGERQARDNAAAARLQAYGGPEIKNKGDREAYLHGQDTISGPTGATSTQFGDSLVPAEEATSGEAPPA